MSKLIRICIAGHTRCGKSFLIGGIKTLFQHKKPFQELSYSIKNNLKLDGITPLEQIEKDIDTQITNPEGTQIVNKYLCELYNSSNNCCGNILIANIPGEAFSAYLTRSHTPTKSNPAFSTFANEFDILLARNFKFKRLYLLLKNFHFRFGILKNVFNKRLNIYEQKLKSIFLEHIKTNGIADTFDDSDPYVKHFDGFLFFHLSDNLIFCIDPFLDADEPINRQVNMLDLITPLLNEKKVKVAITKFDKFFENCNHDYVPSPFNTVDDYLNLSQRKLLAISSILKGETKNELINKFLQTDEKPYRSLFQSLISLLNNNNYLKLSHDNLCSNLFLICNNYSNAGINGNRFPGFLASNPNQFTKTNYSTLRLPLGVFEIVFSILINEQVSNLNVLGFEIGEDYEGVKNVYFN